MLQALYNRGFCAFVTFGVSQEIYTPTQLNNKHHHNGEPLASPVVWDLLIEPLSQGWVKGAAALFHIN